MLAVCGHRGGTSMGMESGGRKEWGAQERHYPGRDPPREQEEVWSIPRVRVVRAYRGSQDLSRGPSCSPRRLRSGCGSRTHNRRTAHPWCAAFGDRGAQERGDVRLLLPWQTRIPIVAVTRGGYAKCGIAGARIRVSRPMVTHKDARG